MGVLSTLGCVLGFAWASGMRLYAAVAVLGLCQHYGLAHLPGDLAVLDNPWIIGTAITLYLIEFVADKVPWVDSAWDAVHGFIRTPAACLVAFAGTTRLDPALQVVAVLLAGGLALSTHGIKAGTRATANLSPEPVSNWMLSAVEEVLALGASLLSALAPLVMLAVVIVFMLAVAWASPRLVRQGRSLLARWRGRRAPGTTPP